MKFDELYYYPDIYSDTLYDVDYWQGDEDDLWLLKHGMVFNNKYDAIELCKKMLAQGG